MGDILKMDVSNLLSEEVIGGLFALSATIYAIHRKFKSDTVEDANNKSEVNIIEVLTKQRDDAIMMADKLRDQVLVVDAEVRELHKQTTINAAEKQILLEKIDDLESELSMLHDIIEYLTDTVDITRKTLDSYKKEE